VQRLTHHSRQGDLFCFALPTAAKVDMKVCARTGPTAPDRTTGHALPPLPLPVAQRARCDQVLSKKLAAPECRFASDEFLSSVLKVVKGSVTPFAGARPHPAAAPLLVSVHAPVAGSALLLCHAVSCRPAGALDMPQRDGQFGNILIRTEQRPFTRQRGLFLWAGKSRRLCRLLAIVVSVPGLAERAGRRSARARDARGGGSHQRHGE
jgi:hypothetical protein